MYNFRTFQGIDATRITSYRSELWCSRRRLFLVIRVTTFFRKVLKLSMTWKIIQKFYSISPGNLPKITGLKKKKKKRTPGPFFPKVTKSALFRFFRHFLTNNRLKINKSVQIVRHTYHIMFAYILGIFWSRIVPEKFFLTLSKFGQNPEIYHFYGKI